MIRCEYIKNGYTTGRPVLRTDTSAGRRQLKLNTFCFKAFAAKKLPDSTRAKGLNDRVIELPGMYGFPQYDISEIINSAGDDEFQELLDELLELRNILLIYRLLHFRDKIPNIKLNIENREKQLFKPVIRTFQNTKTLDELLHVVSKYVGEKRERKTNTLHAFLYKIVTELLEEQNTFEIGSSPVCDTIQIRLGSPIHNKPQSLESVEFGTISQKDITQILIEVFGATRLPNIIWYNCLKI
jgi:hypothetical protein